MMTVIKKINQNAMEMCVSNYTGETSGKLLRTGKFNWEGISEPNSGPSVFQAMD